jgi:hypothetical protein
MQRPATQQSRAFRPMMIVFALLIAAFTAAGLSGGAVPPPSADPPPTGIDALFRHEETNAAARTVGGALGAGTAEVLVGAAENPLVTLGVLAAGGGVLVYRSRRVLLGR